MTMGTVRKKHCSIIRGLRIDRLKFQVFLKALPSVLFVIY